MILIPLEEDKKTITSGFRKAPFFVFLDPSKGIVFEENTHKSDKSSLFFENFLRYKVKNIYVKALGYKTYLKLNSLNIKVYFILDTIVEYSHIDPKTLILLHSENAKGLCTLGHKR